MNRRRFLAAGLAVPGVLARVRSSVSSPFNDLAQVVEQRMRDYAIPGAAFGVVKDGQMEMRGFGITSVEDPRQVTPDTVFELASLSKTVTATAALRLVELGKLDLDAPVRRYIPTFRVQDEKTTADVILRNLLTHTPGWEANYTVPDLGRESLQRWVSSMEQMMQLAPNGRIWSYNNPGFALAGHLIELASGMDIRDAFRELVFKPIGLERASANLNDVVTWPFTVGHRQSANGATEVVRPYSMGTSIPAGGVHMSLASLMKYAGFHLGEHDGASGAINRKTRESMRVSQLMKDPTGEQMGMGWHLRTLNGVMTAAHGGTAGAGHRCHLQLVPERRLGFAILTNHTDGWRLLQSVERATLKAYEGLALVPNQPICGYRGHTETLDHVTALAAQPAAAEYTGLYRRSRGGNPIVVKAADRGLTVVDGNATPSVLFYGPDLAFATSGPNTGINHEFIRDGGQVCWIRIAGQIARKD